MPQSGGGEGSCARDPPKKPSADAAGDGCSSGKRLSSAGGAQRPPPSPMPDHCPAAMGEYARVGDERVGWRERGGCFLLSDWLPSGTLGIYSPGRECVCASGRGNKNRRQGAE